MTRILTIIALLFATPAWAGEVDGNSFFCEPPNPNGRAYTALEFDNGYAITYWENQSEETQKYSASQLAVSWYIGDFSMRLSLDRKSLVLNLVNAETFETLVSWNCSFENIQAAKKRLADEHTKRDRRLREGNQF